MLEGNTMRLNDLNVFCDTIEVEVDYRMSVSNLVKKMGTAFALANLFDSDDPHDLHTPEIQKVEFVLVSHQKMVNSEEVTSDMLKNGIRPLNIKEFLFFCDSKKWQIRGLDFVALGSKTKLGQSGDRQYVPVYRPETFLSLNDVRGVWPLYSRFIGVDII